MVCVHYVHTHRICKEQTNTGCKCCVHKSCTNPQDTEYVHKIGRQYRIGGQSTASLHILLRMQILTIIAVIIAIVVYICIPTPEGKVLGRYSVYG